MFRHETISRAEYKAERIAEELSALLRDELYTTCAAEVGRFVQNENGASVAADEIERMIRIAISDE